MFMKKRKILFGLLFIGIFIFSSVLLCYAQEGTSKTAKDIVSLDFKNADLDDILRVLAQQNNLNLVLLNQVKGKRGTFYYPKITLEDAFNSILSPAGFKFSFKDIKTVQISAVDISKVDTRIFTVRYIDPFNLKRLLEDELSDSGRIQIDRETNSLIITDTFAQFDKIVNLIGSLDIKSTKVSTLGEIEITEQGKQVVTNIFSCRYIDVRQIKDVLIKLLTSAGSIETDSLSNSLIVRDSVSVVEKIRDLINKLDRETPQVMIDAELVEITVGRITEFGVRWLYMGEKGNIGTMNYQYQTEPMPEGVSNYGFPSSASGGSFLFGEVTDEFRGVINALVTDNKANLLANPRITVLNNEKAKIEITEKFPYQQMSGYDQSGNPQYSIQFIDIGIILTVTPSIKEDIVTLELEPEVSYTQGENVGIPIQAMRKATTKVNVRNGKTIVIGGLLSNKKGKTSYKIPILGSIPLIGRLFRTDKDTTNKVELVIFVTPRILSQAKMEKVGEEQKEKYKE